MEVLTGAAAIRRRLVEMQHKARHELRSLVPAMGRTVAISFEDNLDEVERDAMRRGVVVRSVVARAWLERPRAARRSVTGSARPGWTPRPPRRTW
ncbi:hypothetical protein [Streptomyces aureus]|uniref:hypothetical protein n=1 Tax=Streptomyces aureus TaxID=193461 RepID=UPI000A5B73B2|nr:hypothetical protein [Streptomyces aureus]